MKHLNLKDVYKALRFKEQTFLHAYMLLSPRQTLSVNKCKKNGTVHNGIKFDINNNKISRRNPKYLENKQYTCK